MNVIIALIQELRAALVPAQDQHSRRWLTGLGGGGEGLQDKIHHQQNKASKSKSNTKEK